MKSYGKAKYVATLMTKGGIPAVKAKVRNQPENASEL
jgi:hypothetical protein